MTVQPNGTHAKEIALHFLSLINRAPNRNNMAQTIKLAKALMEDGYTYEEIMRVTNHVIQTRKVDIYSFGYIVRCMDEVLEQMRASEQAVIIKAKSDEAIFKQRSEVKPDDSTERNRRKANRTNPQSRIGKKFNFDMFEGQ